MARSLHRARRAASDADEAASRRDLGSTYVEMVIVVTLMAIVIVPTLRVVITSIQASTTATSAAEVETALLNAVDRVNRSPADRCDYSEYATAAVLTQGWDASAVSVANWYLDTSQTPAAWVVGPDPVIGAGCPATGHRNDLIQQVAITVTSPDSKVSRTIKVVKSNV